MLCLRNDVRCVGWALHSLTLACRHVILIGNTTKNIMSAAMEGNLVENIKNIT